MNINDWIEGNSEYMDKEWGCHPVNAIEVSALEELLKTHALVPREPSDEIIMAIIDGKTSSSMIRAITKVRYKAMIKAAEEE